VCGKPFGISRAQNDNAGTIGNPSGGFCINQVIVPIVRKFDPDFAKERAVPNTVQSPVRNVTTATHFANEKIAEAIRSVNQTKTVKTSKVAIISPNTTDTVIVADNTIAYELYTDPDISKEAKGQLIEIGRVVLVKVSVECEFVREVGRFVQF
jgi:hypothetical protein